MLVFSTSSSNTGLSVQAIEIPDGTNAPVSMFSARFDGDEV